MSMYCEKCNQVFETKLCPSCGSEGTRVPEPGDPFFLTEQGYVQSTILADILTQSGIPYMTKMRSIKGCGTIMMSNRLFYVACEQLEAAQSVVDSLFYTHEEKEGGNDRLVDGILKDDAEVFTPEEIDCLEVPEHISPEGLALFSKKLKTTLKEMKMQERLCRERIDLLRDLIDDTDFMLEELSE